MEVRHARVESKRITLLSCVVIREISATHTNNFSTLFTVLENERISMEKCSIQISFRMSRLNLVNFNRKNSFAASRNFHFHLCIKHKCNSQVDFSLNVVALSLERVHSAKESLESVAQSLNTWNEIFETC
jgi:hypothetical protein